MPPKKAAGSKPSAPLPTLPTELKERNGSSRQALKKYVHNNNKITVTSQSAFDAQFNRAVKSGVEKGEFTQPKGPSGPLKLAKKEATKPAAKPAAKKAAKPAATKKAAPKQATTKAATTKKAAPKKTAAAKPKANVAKPRKTPTAPAVVEPTKVLGKTKSGRVTKTTAKSSPKKAGATKKTTTTKKATPKKAAA
ncbi:hypothetical protein PABG_05673 [Paracoccidioides brasiliensis Pb03]|nr:hypothetical protein PABG_05673 [Paracoccidioides brasiliensis Pb03]